MVRRLSASAAFAFAVCLLGSAHADPDSDAVRARELFFQALEAIQDEEWATAESDLRLSQSLVPRASTLYNLALVTFKQGRLLESLNLATPLAEAASEGEDQRYRDYARALVERISKDVPQVELTVSPDEAEVSVDGRVLTGTGAERSLALDPGTRQITVRARGYDEQTIGLVLGVGERRSVGVSLRRDPPEGAIARAPNEASPVNASSAPVPGESPTGDAAPNVMPWVLVGSGGALLVASVITGVLAKDADEDFVAECPELRDCDPRLESLQNRVETLGTLTDVLLVTGGIAVAGGIAWWVVVPRVEPTPGAASGARGVHGLEIRVRAHF